jgi:predicted glycoside hydrolase/deacetylase ChbG (UPF0249 family)
LIVNADDIGYTPAVTDTILDCHERGIVTSATLMVNMPGAEYAAGRIGDFPRLSVGLHLNLTEGVPIAGPDRVPQLVDGSGCFRDNADQSRHLWRNAAASSDVRTEIEAQVERARELGVALTHVDSHHGIHKLPVVYEALAEVMQRFEITRARTPSSRHRLVPGSHSIAAYKKWVRLVGARLPVIAVLMWGELHLKRAGIRMPAWKATREMGIPHGDDALSQLIATIRAAPRGKTSEILLHPGSANPGEEPSDWHVQTWAEDTPICLDPRAREEIDRAGIELISFHDL